MDRAPDSPEDKKTIAIVDPDPAVRHSLEFALRAEGYEVISFALAEDLIATLRPQMLACLVSEYRLPDMTGLDLLAKVEQIHHQVPVFLLVTHPDQSLKRSSDARNAIIVEKPLTGETLIDRIHELTGL